MAVEYTELYGEVPERVRQFCSFFIESAEDMKLIKLNNTWILLNENEGLEIYLTGEGRVSFFTVKERK